MQELTTGREKPERISTRWIVSFFFIFLFSLASFCSFFSSCVALAATFIYVAVTSAIPRTCLGKRDAKLDGKQAFPRWDATRPLVFIQSVLPVTVRREATSFLARLHDRRNVYMKRDWRLAEHSRCSITRAPAIPPRIWLSTKLHDYRTIISFVDTWKYRLHVFTFDRITYHGTIREYSKGRKNESFDVQFLF